MKIGLTIRTFYPKSGGLQAHAENLINALCSQGHEVVVLTWTISRTPTYHDFLFFSEPISKSKVNGIEVYCLRHFRVTNIITWLISKCIVRSQFQALGFVLFNLLFIRQAITAFKNVEIIHHIGQAHEMIGFIAATVASQLRIPFVISPTVHPKQWGDSAFDVLLYRQALRLLVFTKYEAESLRSLGLSQPFDIVGNGIDGQVIGHADRFRQLHGIKGSIILFLGRKTTDKGYFLLKEAFGLLRQQRSDVTLICMGPAASSLQIENSQEGVLELGFGSEQDKHDALAACTILCVPSEGEAFGLVYMEAGRYSKAIIARRLPVLDELLGKKDAALLLGTPYGEGNQVSLSPEELLDGITHLLDNPQRIKELGENAFKVSENFIWPQVVERFETAYRHAVDKNYNNQF